MSCEYLLGLDEFFDYKNQLINDMLTNEVIVKLIADGNDRPMEASELMYSQVFPYEFVPDVTEHGQTFVCCEVDIKEVIDKTFLVAAVYIWVFTHKSLIRLPEGGVRTDKLASEITKVINGSRDYGLGELELQSVRRFSPIGNYQGRILTFYARDYNRLSPTNKPVPKNRKHR